MDSVLRPRDIQARIRSGETPETVAAAAQTTLEKVMVFATPVLAERAWVADQAQKASVRRRVGNGPVGHLGEAVAACLAEDQLDPEGVEWDAWRREDGRWALVADYPAADGVRRATFVYDTAGRYVVAEDDEARRLVGERSTANAALPLDDDPAQLALGDDAIELVTGQRPAPVDEPLDLGLDGPAAEDSRATVVSDARTADAAPAEGASAPVRGDRVADLGAEATIDLSDAVRAARSTSPVPTRPASSRPQVPAPEEWMDTQATERPASVPTATDAPAEDAAGPDDEPPPPGGRRKARKAAPKARGKGRASVPTWDEIMFGSGNAD